jgi:FKBP-type peptidyl-prolyl cis-trans isomerase (trigger factor)
MDQVPCPTNDELRKLAVIAATAPDPRRRLLDLLDDACKFAPPRWLVDKEMRAIWALVEANRQAGRADPADVGKTNRQLRAEYRIIAERRVRLGLVLAQVGMRNHIDRTLRAAAYENEVVDLIFGLAAASGDTGR